MAEFLFTEDNNSVDSEEQPSEYFYNVFLFLSLGILFLLT